MTTESPKTVPTEYARMRSLLQQAREAALAERAHHRVEPVEREPDLLDAVAVEVAREFSERLDDQLRLRLELIERAEEKMRTGTYGTCSFCDEPIPSWRLQAIPWAELCLRCQELTEGMR